MFTIVIVNSWLFRKPPGIIQAEIGCEHRVAHNTAYMLAKTTISRSLRSSVTDWRILSDRKVYTSTSTVKVVFTNIVKTAVKISCNSGTTTIFPVFLRLEPSSLGSFYLKECPQLSHHECNRPFIICARQQSANNHVE